MERNDVAAVQAALADLQQDWTVALTAEQDAARAEAEQEAARAEAEQEAARAERDAGAERDAMRAEQDAEYEAAMVADIMRAPPAAPHRAADGVPMKVRFPDGTEEVFPFLPAACVCEVIQLAQARMGKSAPMTVRVCGQTLDANWSLEMCGLTSPHVLLTAWAE